jgi:hypothetical protein
MGFNPFRPSQRTLADMLMVVGALVATLAVIAWAVFGK